MILGFKAILMLANTLLMNKIFYHIEAMMYKILMNKTLYNAH